jgi:hypothetical protein
MVPVRDRSQETKWIDENRAAYADQDPLPFRTVAGSFAAYEQEVTVRTLGIEFSAIVFFVQDPTFSRNFVSRVGWLDRLRIGIVDYDRLLLVSPYQS